MKNARLRLEVLHDIEKIGVDLRPILELVLHLL